MTAVFLSRVDDTLTFKVELMPESVVTGAALSRELEIPAREIWDPDVDKLVEGQPVHLEVDGWWWHRNGR